MRGPGTGIKADNRDNEVRGNDKLREGDSGPARVLDPSMGQSRESGRHSEKETEGDGQPPARRKRLRQKTPLPDDYNIPATPSSPSKDAKPRPANSLRYERTKDAGSIVREKISPQSIAISGKPTARKDNFLTKKHAGRDLGFWWSGKVVLRLKDGSVISVDHDTPRRVLYVPTSTTPSEEWTGSGSC